MAIQATCDSATTTLPRIPRVFICGMGTIYPEGKITPDAYDAFVSRHYNGSSPVMEKLLRVNHKTGIVSRPALCTTEHPLINGPSAPSIQDLAKHYKQEGVPMAIQAAKAAMTNAGITPSQVTHVVAVTCTDVSIPGLDYFLTDGLGLGLDTEKYLLAGVGCAGGMSILRTASNLAVGVAARGIKPYILCVALEVVGSSARSQLDDIRNANKVSIAPVLFTDAASAFIVTSQPFGDSESLDGLCSGKGYEILDCKTLLTPDTLDVLKMGVNAHGATPTITPSVPKIAVAAVHTLFETIIANSRVGGSLPTDFDWALHPGGTAVIKGVEETMQLSPDHLRASYDIYRNDGNSSSAAVLSVLDYLRQSVSDEGGQREYVIAVGIGPGVMAEMALLRRA